MTLGNFIADINASVSLSSNFSAKIEKLTKEDSSTFFAKFIVRRVDPNDMQVEQDVQDADMIYDHKKTTITRGDILLRADGSKWGVNHVRALDAQRSRAELTSDAIVYVGAL